MIRLKVEHPRKVESLAKEEPSKIRISEPSETHLKFNEILTSCVRNRIYQINFGALASVFVESDTCSSVVSVLN